MLHNKSNCVSSIEKNCCPPFPHYQSLSDDDFVTRNIMLTNSSGEEYNPLNEINTSYPGGCEELAKQERDTLTGCLRNEYDRQEQVARRWDFKDRFWQDLNNGRWYARGLSDNLDETIAERNNAAVGWLNAVNDGEFPGDAPFRDPYCTEHKAYDPYCYRKPLVNMRTFGSRSYKWDTIYQKERYPDQFCKSGEFNFPPSPNPRCSPSCYKTYPETYL